MTKIEALHALVDGKVVRHSVGVDGMLGEGHYKMVTRAKQTYFRHKLPRTAQFTEWFCVKAIFGPDDGWEIVDEY